tara:strand:- start:1367 stop:1996 length:630 start_codon:yes stop_codon:yes gene_type:complete
MNNDSSDSKSQKHILEHKFPYESFIGGWYIPENICDNIINHFNEQKKKQLTSTGLISNYGKNVINENIKDSEELLVSHNNFNYPFNEYRKYLQDCLDKYIEKYNQINTLEHFNINEDYNVQFYKKGGGFKIHHCEREGNKSCLNRVLVFMTYLNDVDDGGTEFFHQKITSPAKKGLTVIWPTDWTHTHKGQVSKTKEKMIITGWYNFDN